MEGWKLQHGSVSDYLFEILPTDDSLFVSEVSDELAGSGPFHGSQHHRCSIHCHSSQPMGVSCMISGRWWCGHILQLGRRTDHGPDNTTSHSYMCWWYARCCRLIRNLHRGMDLDLLISWRIFSARTSVSNNLGRIKRTRRQNTYKTS